MSDVPREATAAAQKSLCDLPKGWNRHDWVADSWFCAQEMLEAALPFLRAQWEADLLSDEAADRFFDRWTLDSKLSPKRAYRESIQTALGSRFVERGEAVPKDA